ncbi:hypothetical protein LFWB_2720 [Candidatus Phytoplasma luffae]|uniref:Uncharacterized protein n=1 Tax=Loofah witches'-broom phytoplasma TaxID=35773 RepID=A0A975ILW1_LOWBP|nr:hypothetical protein LFWB_2720 [Candidatus Phytoplasma luffae]
MQNILIILSSVFIALSALNMCVIAFVTINKRLDCVVNGFTRKFIHYNYVFGLILDPIALLSVIYLKFGTKIGNWNSHCMGKFRIQDRK